MGPFPLEHELDDFLYYTPEVEIEFTDCVLCENEHARLADLLHDNADSREYEVAKLCRIIDAPTQTVLVDTELRRRVESRDHAQFPSWRDVMENSVQIWASHLDASRWPVKPIGPDGELWAWIGDYDSFLGYMAWVIKSLKAGQTGYGPL